MAAILDLAYTVILDHLADKHLGDFFVQAPTDKVEVRNSPNTLLQTGLEAKYRIKSGWAWRIHRKSQSGRTALSRWDRGIVK